MNPRKTQPPCRRCGRPLRDLAHDGGSHLRCPLIARLALLLRVARMPCAACGRSVPVSRAGGWLVCPACRPHMTPRRSR